MMPDIIHTESWEYIELPNSSLRFEYNPNQPEGSGRIPDVTPQSPRLLDPNRPAEARGYAIAASCTEDQKLLEKTEKTEKSGLQKWFIEQDKKCSEGT